MAPPALADGRWAISPLEATPVITGLVFHAVDGTVDDAPFTGCAPSYQLEVRALEPLLDCPFAIAPGVYASVDVIASTTLQVPKLVGKRWRARLPGDGPAGWNWVPQLPELAVR